MARLTHHGLQAAAVILITAMTGCGGTSMSPSADNGVNADTASLRVLVLNPTAAPVNVSVDGASVSSNLPYLGNTGYVAAKSGSAQLAIETSNAVAVNPVNTSLNLAPNSRSTFLLDGWAHFEQSSCLLSDDNVPAANSAAKLRIMDASLAAIHDIYLLPAGSTPGGTPLASLSPFNSATSYQVLAPGAYEIFFTKTGTTEVLFDSGAINRSANQNRTIVVLSDCQPNFCNFNTLTSVTLADLN